MIFEFWNDLSTIERVMLIVLLAFMSGPIIKDIKAIMADPLPWLVMAAIAMAGAAIGIVMWLARGII